MTSKAASFWLQEACVLAIRSMFVSLVLFTIGLPWGAIPLVFLADAILSHVISIHQLKLSANFPTKTMVVNALWYTMFSYGVMWIILLYAAYSFAAIVLVLLLDLLVSIALLAVIDPVHRSRDA